MTTVPKPTDLDLAGGFTCGYDAWNRLTEVRQGQTVVAKYEYDGLNRRVKKHIDQQSPADPNGVDVYQYFFYNEGWQALETRQTPTEEGRRPGNARPAVPVRLVAALHRRSDPPGREQGCQLRLHQRDG